MAKPKIKQREFLIARAFLKRLGGNPQNTYLILAIVAWTRAMAKAHDSFWKGLSNLSASSAGIKLAGRILKKAGSGASKGVYKALITRLRERHTRDDAMASQASDFLLSIEKSDLDKHHYGYIEAVDGHWETKWVYYGGGMPVQQTVWVPPVTGKNPLWDAYAALTNKPGIPKSWWVETTQTVKKTVVPPRPSQPRALLHVLPAPDYIQPYASQRFYDEKPHYGSNILLDD